MNIREAVLSDVAEMQRIRHAVRENVLVSTVIRDEDVADAITRTGKGWVAEIDGVMRGFAVANHVDGSLWALFVEHGFERLGLGRALHDEMLNHFIARGITHVTLVTEPGTRAERFYRTAGWRFAGLTGDGEARFERNLP